jgi:AraC-like DNA-binding protein
MPPMRWALQRRVARARTLLRAGTPPADVAAALGFTDQAHLTRVFRDAMGTTPGRYRAGN